MRIIPIESVQFRNSVYQKLAREQKQIELSEEVSRKTLLKQYGGRKATRALNGREELSMTLDVVQDELQAKVNESVLDEDDPNDTSLNMGDNSAYFDTIRPPHDATATNIKEVFKLNMIIPQSILDELLEDAKLIIQMDVSEIP